MVGLAGVWEFTQLAPALLVILHDDRDTHAVHISPDIPPDPSNIDAGKTSPKIPDISPRRNSPGYPRTPAPS